MGCMHACMHVVSDIYLDQGDTLGCVLQNDVRGLLVVAVLPRGWVQMGWSRKIRKVKGGRVQRKQGEGERREGNHEVIYMCEIKR